MSIPSFCFGKLEGCGNHFVVVLESEATSFNWRAAAQTICNPNFGIGSDGLMIISRSTVEDFEVVMLNPDGSPMGMCGNGIRCVTRYLGMRKLLPAERKKVDFAVSGRRISCAYTDEGRSVTVDMGLPEFEFAKIPVLGAPISPQENASSLSPPAAQKIRLETALGTFEGYVVSMGNPHLVIFVEAVDAVAVEKIGPVLETHERFPNRCNIEFVERISDTKLAMRVWERGAGITLACGTGACASAVAGVLAGLSARDTEVALPGGALQISWDAETNRVLMTGPAREVFEGTFYPTP